ncbi:HET domain-containing protein [Microdochium nivale]|nr:HET domain-containing protein [Microdochium nivale]
MSAAHPQHYQYADSLQETGEIRLFSVSCTRDGSIECAFTHAQLVHGDPGNDSQARSGDTEPRWSCELPYFAISYTWGSELKEETVMVEGKPFPVTLNLYHVLRDICLKNAGYLFWADAISINQGSHAEKNHQVTQMPCIYEAAERVFVLLWEANDPDIMLRYLFEAFEKFDHKTRGNRWPPSSSKWALEWNKSAAKFVLDFQLRNEQQTAAMGALFSHPWFERVWIIQEMAKARSVIIYSSGHRVSSRVFALVPTLIPTPLNAHRQVILDVMPGTVREASWWAQDRSLQNLVRKFHDKRARFGQDKIYALLGICDDPDARNLLAPDYAKTEREVVEDILVYMFSVPRDELIDVFTTISQFTRFLGIPDKRNDLENKVLYCVLSHTGNPQAALALLRDRAQFSSVTSDDSLLDAICQNKNHGNQILSRVLQNIIGAQSVSCEASSKLASRHLTQDEFWKIWAYCSSHQIIRQCWPPPLANGNTQVVLTKSSLQKIMRSQTWRTLATEGSFQPASNLIHQLYRHDSGLPEVAFSTLALVELMRMCDEDELHVLLHAPTKTADICRLLLLSLCLKNHSYHEWRKGQTPDKQILRLLLTMEEEIQECTYRGRPNGSDESGLNPWAHHVKISSIVDNSLPLTHHTTGFTAITRAVATGDLSSTRLLIKQGVDLNTVDYYELTPVLWARLLGYKDVLDELLKHGADPNGSPGRIEVSSQQGEFHSDIIRKAELLIEPWERTGYTGLPLSIDFSDAQEQLKRENQLVYFVLSLICNRYGPTELV